MAHVFPDFVSAVSRQVRERVDERTARVFEHCFENTLGTTLREMPDGTAFMLTGDIPAMWLRDSTAQLTPYLHFAAEHESIADLVSAVSRRQIEYILLDPYANAFNQEPNSHGHQSDLTEQSPWVWERKYEIDSLAYPVQLAHDLWQATGRTDHLGSSFARAARTIVDLWKREQNHDAESPYRFERLDGAITDSLERSGLGGETAYTGMTWAAFRPSDDACTYGFNVPGNIFAAVELGHIADIALAVLGDSALAADAAALRAEIERGLASHALVDDGAGTEVYAYEVNGLGDALLMDDANVPSLLSLPLLGWCSTDDPRYLATRRFVLSDRNPFFFEGTAGKGVGSPHTPPNQIWPIALAIEALTTDDPTEKQRILTLLLSTDAGTDLMHESFHVDNPAEFTRPWFSWANAMFCELVLDVAGLRTRVRRPRG